MRTIFAIAFSVIAGVSSAAEKTPDYYRAAPLHGEAFDQFILSLKQSLTAPEHILVFEGLPHHFEKELLAQERATQKIVKLHDAEFYDAPQKTEFQEGISEAIINCLHEFRGEKLCGGFHADFAITWRAADEKWAALFCYGCGEAAIFSPNGATLRADQGGATLREWLFKFQKLRPPARGPG